MQLKNKIILKVIVLLSCISIIRCQLLDTSGALLSRQKRYLIWHEGINWVQVTINFLRRNKGVITSNKSFI